MAITAFGSAGGFVQCPEGLHNAVCVDVVDLGIEVSDKFFDKAGNPQKYHKIRIYWQVEEKMGDGRPFLVSRRFTLSLNEKSKLRPFLESWRGKAFTSDDLVKGFDVEKLIGVNCTLQVLASDDGRFTDVTNVMPAPKGATLLKAQGYTRQKDREEAPAEKNGFSLADVEPAF